MICADRLYYMMWLSGSPAAWLTVWQSQQNVSGSPALCLAVRPSGSLAVWQAGLHIYIYIYIYIYIHIYIYINK